MRIRNDIQAIEVNVVEAAPFNNPHNPYFRNGNEHWTPQRKREVVNNVKNGRRWFENK